jgi:hypothetical protein
MPAMVVILFAAAVAGSAPMVLDVDREPAVIEVSFRLVEPLPAEISSAVDSGAEVRLIYQLRVKARRKAWWDRKIWVGEAVTSAAFDPVTGRYRCELILDGVIVASRELETTDEVHAWLTAPQPVRVELPENRRRANLKVRARVVFAKGTTWLIFPTQDATDWVEISLPSPTQREVID